MKPLAGLLLLGLIAWLFPDLALYFVISSVLFIIGRPLTDRIKKIRIGKHAVNSSIAAVLTIIAMALSLSAFLLIIIPLINKEAAIFAKIDTNAVLAYFKDSITKAYDFLRNLGLINANENPIGLVEKELKTIISWTNVGNVFGTLISKTSNFFVGLFSVVFLTFFLLREPEIIRNIIMAVTPEKQEQRMRNVLSDTRAMLTRYFLGLIMELISMMLLISLGLTLFGIENAMVLGLLGGLLNIIPYLGPLMGGTIGTILGIISVLGSGEYSQLLPVAITIICVFSGANLIDNFVLQPLIYSKSVNAHPIEIFFVILIAGKIGGVFGMIAAIPAYTVIRIVAKQFMGHFKFVEMLTKDMEFGEQNPEDDPDTPKPTRCD